MKKIIATLVAATMLTACATSTRNITATPVSPMVYSNYSCADLIQEASNIQAKAAQVGGAIDNKASKDKWLTGAGLVVFWPALFFVGHNKGQEADFAQLKGQYEAVQQVATQKQCVVRPS